MLPPHAPEIYLDRATLWNAVENCEKHPKAQLAYSFDIAMQNELTLEENMELARKFVQEQFVAKGMIADLAFHSPEKEDGGIPNPHFQLEKKKVAPMWKGLLMYPIFVVSWAIINFVGLFYRKSVWKPIKHTKAMTIEQMKQEL